MVSREVAEELQNGLEYGITDDLRSSREDRPTFHGPLLRVHHIYNVQNVDVFDFSLFDLGARG